jgi:glycosyltransferase involved in cell wall biosynthesis
MDEVSTVARASTEALRGGAERRASPAERVSPLVSVVIPAYNASQTYPAWELIIVNDGSTDDTVAALAPFVTDPRIRIIDQPNGGVCRARNNGLAVATGDYLAVLDADDEFMPRNLQEKVRALEEDQSADWVYSNTLLSNERFEVTGPAPRGKEDRILESLLLWEGEVVPGGGSNVVFRRRCFEEGSAFDPQFSTAGDQDFNIQLASRYRGRFLPEDLVIYRVLPQSLSRDVALMERDHVGVYLKADRLGLFGSRRFRRRCFANLYLVLAGSWWVNGHDRGRALRFMSRAVIAWPPTLWTLLGKLHARV